MDEEIQIINEDVKKKKIIDLIIKYKKFIYSFVLILFILLITYFIYDDLQDRKNIKISNKYNRILSNYDYDEKNIFNDELIEIINLNNKTYSPLALFFIIDNKLIQSQDDINHYFDEILNNTNIDNEVKNLIIYKKALFNSEKTSEVNLVEILKPVINSDSIWKSHSLLLMGNYFLSKGEKIKANDFYNKIILSKNVNQNILKEAQLRIRKNLNE